MNSLITDNKVVLSLWIAFYTSEQIQASQIDLAGGTGDSSFPGSAEPEFRNSSSSVIGRNWDLLDSISASDFSLI